MRHFKFFQPKTCHVFLQRIINLFLYLHSLCINQGNNIQTGHVLRGRKLSFFHKYEAFVSGNELVDKLDVGTLDKLGQMLTSDSRSLKLLVVFLNLVRSPDLFNIINTVEDEVSQLEKSRKFHLSLYAKGDQDQFGNGEADGRYSNDVAAPIKPEVKNVSSQTSKNELLRAMELRVTALRGELVAAFNRAAGSTCSAKSVSDLIKFTEHFEAINLKESLCKVLQLGFNETTISPPTDDSSSFTSTYRHDNQYKTGGNTHSSSIVHSVVPVKYGVSPSKAAQVERQSSSETEESSDPSDDEPASVERSRTLARSASPRRSSSPMRRIQIGRSGSRRASAITIKSLGYFPARDKAFLQRDAAAGSSGEEESSDQTHKKPEKNLQRMMSVQDRISLFERKQDDIVGDVQKKKSPIYTTVNANKSVLRRWSAGMGESSIQCQPVASENCTVMAPEKTEAISAGEEKTESGFISESTNPIETANVEILESTRVTRAHQPMNTQADTFITQKEEANCRLETSVKWNQQKEAELNHMLLQMTVSNTSKPVKSRNLETKKNTNMSSEQRGGFYDHYKEKRDEKLRGETAGKRAEKEAKLKEMHQTINERKAEIASKNINDVSKKLPFHKPLKSHKSPSQDANPKRETSKPSITKRVSAKPSPLPSVRKSWPSTPLPKTTETPPAKALGKLSSAGTTPIRRKSQPASAVTRPSAKTEKALQGNKLVKGTQTATNKSTKVVNDKQQILGRSGETTKTKVLTTSQDRTSTVRTNPTFYSKITKKSSVVPLESKSLTRKSSENGPAISSTTTKTRSSPQSKESSQKCGIISITEQNEVITNTSVLINQQQVVSVLPLETQDVVSESETWSYNHQICSDKQNTDKVNVDGDDYSEKMVECPPVVLAEEEEEESVISPHAWEEREEPVEPPISHRVDRLSQLASLANVDPETLLSPRIRHSLSQMLQEESSEPDIMEWGNAENPPAMIYQKDAPKGLKRLLKSARSGTNKYNAQSSLSKSQESLTSSVATTKATRSFFSLSAFRGSKPNETKLR